MKDSNHQLTIFKNRIRGSSKPLAVASEERQRLLPNVYEQAGKWLETAAPRGRHILGPIRPRSLSDIHSVVPLSALEPRSQFAWAAHRLSRHKDHIHLFLEQQRILETHLLAGRSEAGLDHLEELVSLVGHSLWAIKLRFALLQRSQGFESQKAYLNETLSPSVSRLVSYITSYVSIRNEATLAPSSFNSFYERHETVGSKGWPEFYTYARYHILPRANLTLTECAVILSFEESASLVDLYEAFVRLSTVLSTSDPEGFHKIAPVVSKVAESINDCRVNRLSNEERTASLLHLTIASQQASNDVLRGAPACAVHGLRDVLTERPSWAVVDMLARAFAFSDEPVDRDCLSVVIARQMALVLALDAQSDSAFLELSRLAQNFEGLTFGNQLRGFLIEELGLKECRQDIHITQETQLGPADLHPFYGALMHFADPLMRRCATEYGGTLSHQYAQACLTMQEASLPLQISPEIALLAKAQWAFSKKGFDQTLQACSALSQSPHAYIRNRAIRLEVRALRAKGALAECVSRITNLFVSNSHLFPLLAVNEVCDSLTGDVRRSLRGDLSLAILFDIHTRNLGSRLAAKRRSAYEDLLEAAGVDRPSQLRDHVEEHPLQKMVYFLRNVCVVSVMLRSRAFRTSREVDDERVAICQLLTDLDPERADDYQAEIKAITTAHAVQGGMREVEQSKIHVDLEGVRSAASKTLKEAFNRYRVFAASGVEQLLKDVMEAIKRAQQGDTSRIISLRLPKGESSEILEGLVCDLRDEFVSNTQYGLDGYLSQRIRHGTLQGHLRSPLEARRLITQYEASSGKYRPNDHWGSQIITGDDRTRAAVAQCLARFSQHFDEIVTRLRTEAIQVRRVDGDKGLFDFRLSPAQIAVITSPLESDVSFEQFIDHVLEHLWVLLDQNLMTIRAYLLEQTKREIDVLVEQLLRDLQALTKNLDDAGLIYSLTHARTEVSRAIDRLAEWFHLPVRTAAHPLPLSLALQVAEETIKKFHKNVDLSVNKSGTADPHYPRAVWVSLVDVFLILFDNVMKHAGLDKNTVMLDIQSDGGSVFVTCENPVTPTVRSGGTELELERIRRDLKSGDYAKVASTEGRSGLRKIKRIIGNDLQIAFGLRDEDIFYVEFSMPLEFRP
ncbi:MAG: hypothetical protein U0R19_35700 [Bryobacteraceae bacterium]